MTVKPDITTLETITRLLCEPESYQGVHHAAPHDEAMPVATVLAEIVLRLKAVLFPGYFGNPEITPRNMPFHVGAALDDVQRLLMEQIRRGNCFACDRHDSHAICRDCQSTANDQTMRFLASLPEVRRLLATDVMAAYAGDPAAKSPGETIFCYPSITALIHHRIAHELHQLGVAIIPRMIAEMAHSATGIDIHPGATIGESFFIDHGTGTVIGETCIIGRNVRLYQGVTLGARTFQRESDGSLTKGQPRHPVVEDDVVIYAGATILGRITIGQGSVIGGNVWLTESVPARSQVVQNPATSTALIRNGKG